MLGPRAGYRWFNLGMAPLAWLEGPRARACLAPDGQLVAAATVLQLRRPAPLPSRSFRSGLGNRDIASPGGLRLPSVLFDVSTLISGGSANWWRNDPGHRALDADGGARHRGRAARLGLVRGLYAREPRRQSRRETPTPTPTRRRRRSAPASARCRCASGGRPLRRAVFRSVRHADRGRTPISRWKAGTALRRWRRRWWGTARSSSATMANATRDAEPGDGGCQYLAGEFEDLSHADTARRSASTATTAAGARRGDARRLRRWFMNGRRRERMRDC